MTKDYCIDAAYQARSEYYHFDDLLEDEWQLEVYLHALGLMKKYDLSSVIDVGCGSGYKLITYLGEYSTLGLELPENVERLAKTYPARKWQISDFSSRSRLDADVVICSDVIEHLVEPDELLDFIKTISYKYLVISTPERDLVYQPDQQGRMGPPANPAHVREWNFGEFGDYLSMHFKIIDHRVTNLGQATQMAICRPYPVSQ